MRVDRDAAPVVGHGERTVLGQRDLDEGRVARHGLVHRVVEHLGEKVVQRALICAADIHAGPAAHGLQAFEHLDRGGVVVGLGRAGDGGQVKERRGASRATGGGLASALPNRSRASAIRPICPVPTRRATAPAVVHNLGVIWNRS